MTGEERLMHTLERSKVCSVFHSHSWSSVRSVLELFQLSVLFLFPGLKKIEEQVGEPQLRGVRGEEPEAEERREERRRGRFGWGSTMARGVTPERLECIDEKE